MRTKYPIYIISKGRWESRLTVKALQKMKTDFRIVVEPSEYAFYVEHIPTWNILIAPENYSELKQGSIPVRNFVWEHSIKEGHSHHWILDDNIDGFIRLNKNKKVKVDNNFTFRAIEDFIDRYENIGIAGMDYRYFAPERAKMPPFVTNTRIYSCILINNSLKFRWRGKYNEDTDLSIRILKSGLCSVLFKAFLCNKVGTLKMKGGNTDTIYNGGDNRMDFAKSLYEQHPDITKIVFRYERWHHEVDYSNFKQKLRFKKDVIIPDIINNYGNKLVKINN